MFIKTQTVPKTSKYFSVLVVDSLYTNLRSMPFPLANINFENDNMRIFLILHLKKTTTYAYNVSWQWQRKQNTIKHTKLQVFFTWKGTLKIILKWSSPWHRHMVVCLILLWLIANKKIRSLIANTSCLSLLT